MSEIMVVLTNCPDATVAERIAGGLVQQGLAACVNQLAPVRSVYRWQGAVEVAEEIPLLIKCTRENYPAVEAAIRQWHPYDVPEVIALPVALGFGPYLRWVAQETTQGGLA